MRRYGVILTVLSMDQQRLYLLAIGLYCLFNAMRLSRASLKGNVTRCRASEEGMAIHVPLITDQPCISCHCQNRQVKCTKEVCNSLDGCHMILFDKPKNVCCDQCKGCFVRGKQMASGDHFVNATDPCRIHTCQVGVLMSYTKICHVSCSYPVPAARGQCCPTCQGCVSNGQVYDNGETMPSVVDPCLSCVCTNGETRCEKHACPVLNCHARYQVSDPKACCPVCRGSRRVFRLPRRVCLFRKRIYPNNTHVFPDKCTKCICLDSTMHCERQQCGPIKCAPEDIVYSQQLCCPRCKTRWKSCKVRYRKYKHGDVWKSDECTNCNCNNGVVRCHVQQCDNGLLCPPNTQLRMVKGKCCPQCIDDGAVCAVFGDPHYRSFDGRIFSFQGGCSYILVQPCRRANFSIRVHNDFRTSNGFAWTKSVRVMISNYRVFLLPKMRLKVNRRRVKAPYEKKGLFALMQGGHSVILKTTFGVKIIWDGNSYLEVSVPATLKNSLCGLCGNYNNDETDDFQGRDGHYYFDASDFGRTWRVGRRRHCHRNRAGRRRMSACRRKKYRHRRARKVCRVLRGPAFARCRKKIDVKPYYRSCLMDMCDCPRRKRCSCESLKAYSRECERVGGKINWRASGLCNGSAKCSEFDVCRNT